LKAFQQPSKETFGCVGIPPRPNEDIEHDAVLIHGAPKVVLHALNPDEYLIEVPLVTGPRTAAAQRSAKVWPNFSHPRRMVSSETTMPHSATRSSTSRRLRVNT